MVQRLARHLGVVLDHRETHARLGRRTQQLAQANEQLALSLANLKEAQAQVVQAGKMAGIGQLAAGVAHEINNPLAYMVANVAFALEELGAPEPRLDECRSALADVQEGLMRVRNVVNDLKAFSRRDSPGRECASATEALQSSIRIVQNEIRHRAELILDVRDVPPVAASADRLQQVFVNLLINAAQSITEGAAAQNQIRVAVRPHGDGHVAVEIVDTGCGIPEDVLPRIFEPFFTTKPVGTGTGLGLSICHGIVSEVGGRIEVESRIGRGSTFRILLPVQRTQPRAAEPTFDSPARLPALRRQRVLVVDDEPMVGRGIARTLSATADVEVFTGARAALQRLRERDDVDAIFCDLMMPEMTGMQFHEHLASAAPELCERIVFLTGGAFTPLARAFLDRVPNRMLPKPYDPVALRDAVASLSTSRRA
jgi:signal transduction histidine kinase/CheY-like chemotaxis protein